jgi:hypothetical protein
LRSVPSFSDVTVPLTVKLAGIVVVETDVVEAVVVVDAAVVVVGAGWLGGVSSCSRQSQETRTSVRTAMVCRI